MRRHSSNQLVLDLERGDTTMSSEPAPDGLLPALAELLLQALGKQKITSDHLGAGAGVYIRQSTPGQVAEHTESQRRQYALVEAARTVGFASITVIDDDLGRSGSGLVERPGFEKLVALVCS